MSWAEKLEKKGEERGIAIGEERGERRGERRGIAIGKRHGEKRILKRVLRKRFGALPATIDEQLDALSTEQLEAAIEHVFSAPILADLSRLGGQDTLDVLGVRLVS